MPTAMRPPPAPSKTRALPTRTTRTTRTTSPSSSSNVDPSLADNLTALSLDSAPKKLARTASSSTSATKRAATASTSARPPPRPTSTNKPLPSTSRLKPLAEAPPERTEDSVLSVDDRAKEASATISASLASLSTLAKSGFRAEQPPSPVPPPNSATPTPSSRSSSTARPGTSNSKASGGQGNGNEKEKAESIAKEAGKAFQILRHLGKDNLRLGNKRVSIEGMAGRFIAELIQIQLYRYALIELSAMRQSILSWYLPANELPALPPPTFPLLSHAPSLLVPVPPRSYFSPPTLSETLSTSIRRPTLSDIAPLVLALQQSLLNALFRSSALSSNAEAQRSRTETIEQLLRDDGNGDKGGPMDWKLLWETVAKEAEMDEKEKSLTNQKLDATLLGLFQTITNGTSSVEDKVAPELLLNLRIRALLYYCCTSNFPSTPSQLPAFHTQHRKILLRYGRSAQTPPYSYSSQRIAEEIRVSFVKVMKALESRGLSPGQGGSEWTELCQVVLHLAKKGNDTSLVSSVSRYLVDSESSSSTSTKDVVPETRPAQPALPPSTQASQIVASLHRLLALFDLFAKSPSATETKETQTLLVTLRRTPLYFDKAAQLLILSTTTSKEANHEAHLPLSQAVELENALHQIRSTFTRYIRTPPDNPKNLLRSDELVTLAGSAKPIPVPTDTSPAEIHHLVRQTLNAFVSVVERSTASKRAEEEEEEVTVETKKRHRLMRAKGVETLILLAHDSLSISDRTTHSAAYAYLSRALPLLRLRSRSPNTATHESTSKLDLDLYYSIHSLASVFYNIAARLFSASRGDGAVRFAKESCLLTREALEEFSRVNGEEDELARGMQALEVGSNEAGVGEEENVLRQQQRETETREDRDKIRKDLQKNAGRRWELLGLAQHVVEDRKAALEAYLFAIVAQPPTLLSQLATDSSQHSLSDLLTSYGPLYKLVERATRISTFDLLLPPEQVSFAHAFASSSEPISTDLQGILLEFQLHVLDQVLEQTSSQRAASAVLASLDQVYTAKEYPIRRSRILVRTMQQLCVGSHVAQDLKPAALAAEIDDLCSNTSKTGLDGQLAAFSAQYLSLSHLFLGFHAHHSRLTSSKSVVETEARQCLSILRKALEGDLPSSPSIPTAAQTKVTFQASPVRSPTAAIAPQPVAATRRRTTRATATPAKARTAYKTPQTSRTLAASRRTAPATQEQEQITPPEKNPLDTLGRFKPTPLKKGDNLKANLDGAEKVYRLLGTMAHLLGALGHSLLKMSFLKFLRRLSAKLSTGSDTAFVVSSSLLAHEYIVLGKTMRAGTVLAQAEQRTQLATNNGVTLDAASETLRLLSHAEYLASIGNHDRASRSYESAMSLAQSITTSDGTTSVTTKIVEMTLTLQRVALASGVHSVMLQRKGDLARSLAPALQAMRLCDRALNNVSRLEPSSKLQQDPSAPFNATPNDHVTPLRDHPSPSRNPYKIASGGAHAGLAWQLAEQLAQSILRVSSLHLVRGSPKDAEFYATQAIDLARNLGSERLIARATALRAEVKILLGRWEDASNDLEQMEVLLGSSSCPEAIEVRRLGADLLLRNSLQREAYDSLVDAQKHLEAFVRSAAEAEAAQTPIRRSTSAKSLSPAQQRSASKAVSPFNAFSSPNGRSGNDLDWILPASHAFILRMQVALLRLQNKPDQSQALLRRLAKLSSLEEDKADELLLLASIHLQDMLSRCTSDPVLGMLPDSVLSIPAMSISLSSTTAIKIGTPRTGPTILNSLKDVDGLLVRAAAYSASRSQPNKLRELSLINGTMRTFHANVGKPSKRAALSVAHLLDLGTAVTLRREMLDAIDYKLAQSSRQDDLLWPSAPLEDDEEGEEPSTKRRLLIAMRDRYRLETPEPALTDSSMSSILPANWSAISLHLTTDRDNLILVRHRRESEPIVFKLPLDRLARREGEDESFTYDNAINELNDIIASTKVNSQNAKNVKTREEREAWWQERQELDTRLKDLLQMVEDNWLGAFKSIFCDARSHPSEGFASFKARIERVLKRGIVRAANDKKSTRFKLNDAIVECVAGLPASSREEDLEDLFFFMTEAFQFSGVPVSCDETDVDQVVVDLREALEELHGTKSAPKGDTHPDEHTFLILDKTLAAFPWESLPCLLGRSVSRLPSLSFLRDRIDLASTFSDSEDLSLEVKINVARTAFVLNPGGDLLATQRTFEPWLQEESKKSNWNGVIGRAPLEEEFKSYLTSKDLVLYFGHGGAEQYIRRRTIRHLPQCAVTMLWGCSSGILKDQGDFDPVGTPYNYMISGSPALVANLWDVTDKDIDKFAQSVFEKTGIVSSSSSADSTLLSLTSAVAQSRKICNLRYLNGAAPVVYGIPVRFTRQN